MNNEQEREKIAKDIAACKKRLDKLIKRSRELAIDTKFTPKVDSIRPDLDSMKDDDPDEGLGALVD